MSIARRFAVDERRNVIDAINGANSGKAYCREGHPEDDKHLREQLLQVRLGELLGKLIINLRPTEINVVPMQKSWSAVRHQPYNEERCAIEWAILSAIRASHLNAFDPALSVQHKFDGKLRRQKERAHRDITSLSLFRDDVESLLRDLYGDLESEALDSVVLAVFSIVQQFARYVRPDLCKEHDCAADLDWMLGIGLPEGAGITGSDHGRGNEAKFRLIRRVREVNAKPSTFSEYTIEFANLFAQRWDCSEDWGKDFLDKVSL
jgi:hypothetical protein